MKKLFSSLLVFITIVLGSLPTTMAFTMPGMNEDMPMMGNTECSQMMQMDCEKTEHECCLSPFVDSFNQTGIQNNMQSHIINLDNPYDFGFDFLALLQENQKQDYIKLSNAPPRENHNYRIRDYHQLIGIIKSNT